MAGGIGPEQKVGGRRNRKRREAGPLDGLALRRVLRRLAGRRRRGADDGSENFWQWIRAIYPNDQFTGHLQLGHARAEGARRVHDVTSFGRNRLR